MATGWVDRRVYPPWLDYQRRGKVALTNYLFNIIKQFNPKLERWNWMAEKREKCGWHRQLSTLWTSIRHNLTPLSFSLCHRRHCQFWRWKIMFLRLLLPLISSPLLAPSSSDGFARRLCWEGEEWKLYRKSALISLLILSLMFFSAYGFILSRPSRIPVRQLSNLSNSSSAAG